MDNDEQRFEALFRQAYPPVTRYVTRRVDPDAVQEIVAEVFLIAWRRFDSVPDNALPWLLVTARNLVGNEYRRRARTDRLTQRVAAVRPAGQHDWIDDELDRITVRQALASLRTVDQEVLRLADWDDLSPTDAATVAGCSVATYKMRLHRARRRLETALAAQYRPAQPALTLLTHKEAR